MGKAQVNGGALRLNSTGNSGRTEEGFFEVIEVDEGARSMGSPKMAEGNGKGRGFSKPRRDGGAPGSAGPQAAEREANRQMIREGDLSIQIARNRVVSVVMGNSDRGSEKGVSERSGRK